MKVKVSCECKDFLALGELTEFQGGLKSRTEFDVDGIPEDVLEAFASEVFSAFYE